MTLWDMIVVCEYTFYKNTGQRNNLHETLRFMRYSPLLKIHRIRCRFGLKLPG